MTLAEISLPAWFINGVLTVILCSLVLGLYWLAEKILHVQLHSLVELIKSELDDSKAGLRTVGAYNWRGFIALMGFGVIAMIFMTSQKLLGFAAAVLGVEKAAELAKATDFFTLVYALALWMFGSLLCVLVDKKSRAK
jgi:hypothetical protein